MKISKNIEVVRPFKYQGRTFTEGETLTEDDIIGILQGYLNKGMVKRGSVPIHAPKPVKSVTDHSEIIND